MIFLAELEEQVLNYFKKIELKKIIVLKMKTSFLKAINWKKKKRTVKKQKFSYIPYEVK